MVTTFQTQLPGYGLTNGDDLNVIIDTLNTALVAAGSPARQIGRLESGYRLVSGGKLQEINLAIQALGKASPVKSIGGVEPGYRLHQGMLIANLGAAVGVTPGTAAGGGSVVPANAVTYQSSPVTYQGAYVTH